MLFILDKSYDVVGSLNSDGDLSKITTYFDDSYVQELSTGAETFQFSTLSNSYESQHLIVGNFIAFKEDGDFKLFNIVHIEETHEDVFIKTVYCEMASIELINEIIRPVKILNCSLRKLLDTILESTEWQLGKIDAGFTQVHDFEITDYKSAYALIQEYVIGVHGAEISYRVEIEHGRVTGKYIDCYKEKGNSDGFRFAYGSNLTSVTRTVDSSNLATALIGVGNNGITFKEVDTEDKPLNQDFIVNEAAYEQWNINGSHIFGTHKADTDSPQELLRLTRIALAERANPQIKYEMKAELLDREVKIGDTVNVVDHEFNPPLYLSARVNKLTKSKTNPYNDEVVLANFKELRSNITEDMRALASQLEGYVDSQFPIGGDKIQNGAIGKEQFSKTYHTEIVADAVYASLVETEELIAGKANIGDLEAVNARIENLQADKADITELNAQKAEIEELIAKKADIESLKAITANIETLYTDKANVTDLNALNATVNNLKAEKADIKDLNATNATINQLKADKADINSLNALEIKVNTIDANKANISDLNATNATIGTLQANKADIAELNAVKGNITILQSEVAEIGQLKSDVADIEHILAGNITADNIATGTITAGSGIIADGAIGNAQISSIDAGKVSAGTVDTSKVTIQGADGHLRIKGNRLQVFQGTGNQAKERVSLGDVNGNGTIYGLRVRGADGKTVLLDENGVTSEGLTDGSITNDKISDDANIDGAKLNINSVVNKINEDGTETIQGTKIEVNGTSLVTKLSSITNKQTEDSNKITQAQSQITANTNAIKLKVDEQTYQSDKEGIETSLNKHTSEISTMKGQIALKVEQTDIANAKSELEGKIDTKVASAKAEIKATTDSISQSVSNLSNTVSTKADGTTVSNLSSKVGTLETSVNGITGRVSNVEKTTTTLGTQIETAQSTADSAVNKADKAQTTANTNKNNISSLQGEVSTVKSNVASLEVTTSGISQKVSNVESTTATLTTQVGTAQSTADSKAKVFTSTPTVPYKVGDLWVQGTSGDVMKCKTARSSGSYSASDWEKASKYTDDTKANAVDSKVTTLNATVNTTNSKVASLETNLDGITQRVSSTESTTATLTTKVDTAQSTADSAKTTANTANKQATTNKNNISTLTTTVNNTNNKVAEITTNLDSITQRVSSTESTTTTLTEKVNVTVKDVKVYYAINTSSTTAPTSGWSTTPPTWENGKYIWSKTTTTLTNGTSTTTNPVCITGAKGATGQTGAKGDKGDTGATGASGKGVKSITNYYLASTANSGVTTSTSGWTTTVQSVSNSKKYLWNYEKVTYTDSTSTSTTPCIIGAYGDTGATGATGAAGKGIKSIVEYYAVSSSNTTAPTSWSTTMQNTTTTNKYLWNYEVITYTDNSTTSTTKKVIGTHGATGSQGAKGDTGATGTGIESITTEYYLSTSKTTQTGGSWVTTQPQWSNGKYLWTRSKIVYKNPTSTAYTTPVCDSSWDAINDIEIGGRNLLKDTNKGNVGWSWGLGGSQSGYYSISSHICEDSTNGVKFKRNETEFSPTWNYVSYSGSKIVGNKIKPNTEYTLSMEVKSSVACSIRWSIKYGDGTNAMVKDSSLMQIEKDKWVKFKVASTSLSTLPNFSSNHCIYLTGFPSSANCEFYIKNIKLEEGNKATDWTPAPEDVQSQIDTNKANISTTSSKVAEITTNLDSITQRVSSTETTVSNINANTDKLSLGLNKWLFEIFDRGTITGTTRITINDLLDKNPRSTLLIDEMGSLTSIYGEHFLGRLTTNVYFEADYSWTVNATSDDGGTLYLNGVVISETNTTARSVTLPFKKGWNKVTWVFNENTGNEGAFFSTKLSSLSQVKAMNAYSQTNIDEDKVVLSSNINSTNSKVATIETNLTGITQRVSSTESTVSTHTTQLGTVDSRINTAKNDAISTASNDATTKANNALANAKTDATTKANNALADAKTYTNGQITTVNTTINNKVAEIKATTDAITQRVSSTESNLSTTTSKIDNLTIGGNNHIINGAFALDGYWTHWGSPAIREYITRDNKRWCHIKGSGTALYQGISQNQYNNGITVKPNTQYTISADVYGGASNQVFTVGIHWIDSSGSIISQPWNNFTVGTTPQKVHFTVTTPSNVRNFNIMVGVNHASIAYDVYFTNLKFELGNKATDYSPSPQETQHQINNNKESLTSLTTTVNNTNSKVSSLETNLNSITSRVSATETTTSSLTTQMSNKEDVNSRVIYAKGNGNDAPSNSIVKVGSSALVSGHGRGLNIVALNPTTLAQYYKGTFDTYGGDNYRTQFAEKIQELNNGNYIIVVTSHDSACLNYATVCNALYLIGGSAPSTSIASYREAYALIGKSKLGKGNGLEMYIPKTVDDARVAEVSVKVSEQGALLGVNSNNSESKIDTLTTRVSTAESKLTKDSLTTTIGSHYTTSTDVNNAITSKGYATTSQVQQTTNALSAKFSSSGGYNLLRNTSFANGATHWNHNATCTVDSSKKYGSNNSLKMVSSGATSAVWRGTNQRFVDNAPIGKTYRATLYYYIEDKSTFNSNFTLELKGRKTGATSESGFVSTSISASNLVQGAWTKVTVTATTSVAWDYMYIYPWIHMSGTIWISDVIVTEGELEVPWSPHPSEIYDGVTTIDKNGVKVSQSNYNGYTQMKADGFYVNNGSENVISVTSSGATFKGKVTIQSGSTVPTSTLSGTISSGQLESTITNDISTAKTNASSALSTANTAKSTADTAKSTANTANAQATTNKNNISTLTTTVTNTNNKVSTLETNLSGITSRVGTVETKTTTLEGKVTSHESRIKTAENKITDSAIINTVSSTIDSKVNAGISNIKLGGKNYIYYGKGDVKKGFFTSFNKVDDGYGEHTLTSQKTYTSVGIGNGFLLGCRDYEVGKQITFSYEIMYTKWDFPAGTNRSEFWMGQRYTGGTTESSDGAWRSVTSHTLPEVGKNGCELNKWFKVEKVITIPQQAHSSIGAASAIQFYNSNADVSASVTFRLRNVKIEYGNKATDWTPSPEETENIISDTEKLLNENIDNAISDVQNSILQNVSDNYATSEKLDILSQTVSSNMTQTNNNINMQFETATNYTKEVDGKLQNFQNTVGTHIRFSENGIDLGKTNSPFTATLDNTQLAFKQDGSTVAYISNNKMHITQAEIKESLRVGTNENGYFSWVQGPKGNLSLKWSDK